MNNENSTSDMDVDSAYEAIVLAESENLFLVLWRAGQVLACVAGLALGVLFYQAVHHKLRVEYARYQLDQLGATHLWQHETFSRTDKSEREKKKAMRSLAAIVGDSTVAGFSVVGIENPNATDADLGFLQYLDELRTLRIASDRATNVTLNAIAQLPNLRYLHLFGDQFSIHGLLKLRSAESLRELTIEKGAFTPIELAVLHAELPAVVVKESTAHNRKSEAPTDDHSYPSPTLPFASVSM